MRFINATILLIFLSSCQWQGEKFYGKDCIYHHWQDNKHHCSKYRLIPIEKK
jgi:hypothetical protein